MTYRIGGAVGGLVGTLVLHNNSTDDLILTANGQFTFPTAVTDRSAFLLSIGSQPAGQTCSISNGSGTVSGRHITDVSIVCSANTFRVGGSVAGLVGNLVLHNNNADDLTLGANGSFTFPTVIADHSPYRIHIGSQPAGQTCSISNGSGTIADGNVTNVMVVCSPNTYRVSGSVTGLVGELIVQNNSDDNVTISADGIFSFETALASGSDYAVTVLTKPLNQVCSLTNASGSSTGADVRNVAISCANLVPKYAYVPNDADDTVSQYTIDPDGSLTPMTPPSVSTEDRPKSVTVGPNGRYVYVTNFGENSVSQYTISPDGSLTPMTPPSVPAGDSPQSVVIDKLGRHAYVANWGSYNVSQYTIGSDGRLTPMAKPTVPARSIPTSIALAPGGQHAYVTNHYSDNVTQYRIEADGGLAPLSTPTVLAGDSPFSIAVHPNGRYAYVANNLSLNVSQYLIDPDGNLSPMATPSVPTGNWATWITIDPGGRYAYVANSVDDNLSQYTIGADGSLIPMTEPTVPAERYPESIVLDPSGRYAYATSYFGNKVLQYTIRPDGSLVAMSTPSVPAGGMPRTIAIASGKP